MGWNKRWLKTTYNTKSQIEFNTKMLKSSLCDYSDAYIFVKGRITITGAVDNSATKQTDEINKGVIYLKIMRHLLTA